jgi:transcriptional regulator with XRE-family HTH domain
MKFGDKLIVLRKKNGLSQEELAEKLGVSRQSVSKWESNNTYPETDKIVQICNLFDCSMDDLINDKVTDVEGSLRKNKNNFNEVWDSLLEFITKSINMFSHMKFTTGLKCVIEMFIIAFLLWLVGLAVCGISSNIIAGLFDFSKYSVNLS